MPEIANDRILIGDHARRLFDAGQALARARQAAARWPGTDRAVLNEFTAMGWPSLLLAEDDGGMGGGITDFVALIESLGDLVLPEPVGPILATVPLLAACRSRAASDLLKAALGGEITVLAAVETERPVQVDATHLVFDAHWADVLVFALDDPDGFSLRAVAVTELGDRYSLVRSVDGGSLGFARLDASVGDELAAGAAAREAFMRCRHLQWLAAAASLLGLARKSLADAIDYVKLRRQFGVAVGSFQALQHRAATLHVACQSARALLYEAARTVGTANEELACAAAKVKAAETAMAVVKESVQFHGAIGFSDEADIALYFRRAVTLTAAYGAGETCYRSCFSL